MNPNTTTPTACELDINQLDQVSGGFLGGLLRSILAGDTVCTPKSCLTFGDPVVTPVKK